jgi:hypothetical protein
VIAATMPTALARPRQGRCGRRRAHPRHTWVESPQSPEDLICDGKAQPRHLPELFHDHPLLAEVGVGGFRHAMAVALA